LRSMSPSHQCSSSNTDSGSASALCCRTQRWPEVMFAHVVCVCVCALPSLLTIKQQPCPQQGEPFGYPYRAAGPSSSLSPPPLIATADGDASAASTAAPSTPSSLFSSPHTAELWPFGGAGYALSRGMMRAIPQRHWEECM
jgi:hypothetical protein